jgi:hypothetical protein
VCADRVVPSAGIIHKVGFTSSSVDSSETASRTLISVPSQPNSGNMPEIASITANCSSFSTAVVTPQSGAQYRLLPRVCGAPCLADSLRFDAEVLVRPGHSFAERFPPLVWNSSGIACRSKASEYTGYGATGREPSLPQVHALRRSSVICVEVPQRGNDLFFGESLTHEVFTLARREAPLEVPNAIIPAFWSYEKNIAKYLPD